MCLIADEDAFGQWMGAFADTDSQQLRALIRQARKDAPPADRDQQSRGLAPRQSRAFRELFQLVREQLRTTAAAAADQPADAQ